MIRCLFTLILFFVCTTASGVHISTCHVVVPCGGNEFNLGSGAKVAEDGHYDYVITASHVVHDNGRLFAKCQVRYLPHAPLAATVVGYDRDADIAVLRTKRTGIEFYPLARAEIGETVWTEGLVTGTRASQLLNRKWSSRNGASRGEFIGVPKDGDSGGPIRNTNGHVVAVLHGGGISFQTMATETHVILQRVPTPLRNVLRVVTGHPTITALRPVAVSTIVPCPT